MLRLLKADRRAPLMNLAQLVNQLRPLVPHLVPAEPDDLPPELSERAVAFAVFDELLPGHVRAVAVVLGGQQKLRPGEVDAGEESWAVEDLVLQVWNSAGGHAEFHSVILEHAL